MSHQFGDILEFLHHALYFFIRGKVYEVQYVGTVKMGEEELEERLFHPHNIKYNPLAYWKRLRKKDSLGSWRLTHQSHPEYVEPGMQLHITLFHNDTNPEYTDIYCHYEEDWAADPLGHYHETGFSAKKGVAKMTAFIMDETDLQLYDKEMM